MPLLLLLLLLVTLAHLSFIVLNAQVRLVDMIQDQMVASLDEREAAVTTRPNSVRQT